LEENGAGLGKRGTISRKYPVNKKAPQEWRWPPAESQP
jgi:hypothetical protein